MCVIAGKNSHKQTLFRIPFCVYLFSSIVAIEFPKNLSPNQLCVVLYLFEPKNAVYGMVAWGMLCRHDGIRAQCKYNGSNCALLVWRWFHFCFILFIVQNILLLFIVFVFFLSSMFVCCLHFSFSNSSSTWTHKLRQTYNGIFSAVSFFFLFLALSLFLYNISSFHFCHVHCSGTTEYWLYWLCVRVCVCCVVCVLSTVGALTDIFRFFFYYLFSVLKRNAEKANQQQQQQK